ncbi:MAG: 16S rRNA (uracil(1498)-N(3))-methyltransferase [Chlamydiales bacterium]|nr:16S rRNA (uracil(1498)-N(3))-methyltransferase [Chlamydiales bacterium]
MPQNRYYYEGVLQEGSDIALKDDEFHYLKSVMRTRVGESIEVINGQGSLAQGEVIGIFNKEAHITLSEVKTHNKPQPIVKLALAFLKPSHLEYAIEKGCEIGVDAFILFNATKSEKKAVSDQYLKRLHSIILSSTKQCGRLFLPTLEIKDKLKECLDGFVVFGDLESTTHIKDQAVESQVTLVVGPESGFTDQERTLLLEYGAKGVRLHPNTLRAETAAVVACALLTAR